MNYEEKIRHPGEPISSGADMLEIFGHTDVNNPIYSFDLMNDSYFGYLKELIDKEVPPSDIPKRYNANIIRLRDYRLGSMLNDLRELCNSILTDYEDAWEEYQEQHNPEMPSDFYHFWSLDDKIFLEQILSKFINLIDPVSMEWIDPNYEKVTIKDKDIYEYKIDKPILTADPTFLYPKTKMEYYFHDPISNPIVSIYEELPELIRGLIPNSIYKVEYIIEELKYKNPKEGESQKNFINRIKSKIRKLIPG